MWCCVAERFKDRAQPPVGITVLESSCPAMLDAFLALVLQQFGINGPGDSCRPRWLRGGISLNAAQQSRGRNQVSWPRSARPCQ